ncbi:hypothetical protein [Leptotrichia trevisanii]|jgi:hypothetical protein|uniref:hypothetical protein n=1 Tax=Leptotrichia trevisanii TaxID=109328 RepID=UPI000417521D|nr:hypothetical protein [Leptotrichia trevisanii]DAQ00665.1 MAG TPA: hypothetical protein [Caudoviricetes sp.]
MLEKHNKSDEKNELNEDKLETIKFIPKVVAIELCRISKQSAEELIKEINERLIPDSKIFIKIFIGTEKYSSLDKDNERILEELYVAWKLYESLENEKVSEDKRDTLYKLLEQLKGSSLDGNAGNSLATDGRYGKIMVFTGD